MLPYPLLLWADTDLRGGPVTHTTQIQHHVMYSSVQMKLTCRGYTPGLITSPPSFLPRSFFERVGPRFSAVLFFAFPFESDAVRVGFFFMSVPLDKKSTCETRRGVFDSTVSQAASVSDLKLLTFSFQCSALQILGWNCGLYNTAVHVSKWLKISCFVTCLVLQSMDGRCQCFHQ